jgi:hypothetical protein
MNKCDKCGKAVDYSFRYCPTCGGQLYVSLDTPNAKPEMFIDLFNSLYNLLADKNNDSRSKYLPNLSENIIARRCKLEYEDDYQDMIRNLGMKFVPPNAATDMYYLSLTNTLAGYTYRSIEELIVKRKSEMLSEAEKRHFMSSLLKDAEHDLENSCYKVLDTSNFVDNRVLFCLSVRWKNGQLKYLLADDIYQREWFFNILSQNIAKSMKYHEKIFKLLMPGADVTAIVERKREAIEDGTEQDFLFGYIVKLSESLSPY